MYHNKLITIGNTHTFPHELARLKSVWIPENNEHTFLECFKHFLTIRGIMNDFDWNELPKNLELFEEGRTTKRLQTHFKLNVEIYHIKPQEKYNSITIFYNYPLHEDFLTIRLFTHCNYWGLLLPNKRGEYVFINHFGCKTCARWIHAKNATSFCTRHYESCRQCKCGKAYKKGDSHPSTCNKLSRKKYKPNTDIQDCKLYSKEKDETYLTNNHFADFECIHENGFEVDSTGLYDSNTGKVVIESGRNCLEHFFNYLKTIEGTLWFFNGGKFDTFFIVKYCIQNGYDVVKEETLIKGNWVQVLTLSTIVMKNGKKKKSKLKIKDLARFLQGSLDSNCRAFKIPEEYYKREYDHEKVKTWDDFEKHKEERLEYLKYDVLALKEVYTAYGKAIWDDFNLNLCDFISSSQLSYAASTLYIAPGKMKKILIKDEAAFREAYYGGRIVTTYQQHLCEMYDLITTMPDQFITKEIYDSILDDLKQYDANSLYPSQMFSQKFPCGNYYHVPSIIPEREQSFITDIMEESKDPKLELWAARLIRVSMTPPSDIYIPFLMSRDLKNMNQQTLEPIVCKWYSGVEVLEAIRVGYKLTNIHEFYVFQSFEPLFQEFVRKVYTRRLEARAEANKMGMKDGGPIDVTMKGILNQNTGKHAQRIFHDRDKLIIGKGVKESVIDSECKFIWNNSGDKIHAIIKTEHQDYETTPFAMHITLWCLSYSRIFMSKFTDSFNGYRNPRYVPRYGDTDSLFLLRESVELIPESFFGDDLCQLKDEMPSCKIIGLIVLAPKTYMKLILLKNASGYKLMTQLKCKGISHARDMYAYHGDYSVSREKYEHGLAILQFLESRKSVEEHYPKPVQLKERLFISKFKSGEIQVTSRITWQQALANSRDECLITGISGTMVRCLGNVDCFEKMGIYLDYTQRCLSVENWWKKGKRITETNIETITKPLGFEEPPKDGIDFLLENM